jgi:hypothetical protein
MPLIKTPTTEHYYRTVRVDGKVKREYLGCGKTARLAAAVGAGNRQRRQKEREELVANQRKWDGACAPLEELIVMTDLLVTASLLAAGYHQHHQGEWRLRHAERQD